MKSEFRGHVLETPPATEPVTAQELRGLLRESVDGLPDAEAESLISTAREYIEEITGLAMIDQSWRLSLDAWPRGREPWWDGVRDGHINVLRGGYSQVILPRYPLASVTSVTVYNQAGVSSVVDVAATFDIDTYQRPGRMVLKSGAVWPVALRDSNAIQIIYEAGFTSVPNGLKRAVMQMAASLYTHRGDGCSMADAYTDSGAAALAGVYAVRGI
jgi:hypothetical protein